MAFFMNGTLITYDQLLNLNILSNSFFYPTIQNMNGIGTTYHNQLYPQFPINFTQSNVNCTEQNHQSQKQRFIPQSETVLDKQQKISSTYKIDKKLRNLQKQLESAKKNCQSNLVNQFLSYFSSFNSSSDIILRVLVRMGLKKQLKTQRKIEQTILFFCKIISIVNSRKQRKYVNKSFLQNYFTVEKLSLYMSDLLQKLDRFQGMSTNQFCQIFRRCCFNFFRTVSIASVASSAKLNQISRPQHIKRRRLIVKTLGAK